MADPKIPSDGPLLAANTQKLMNEGYRQRAAVSIAGLRAPKGDKK
jgi:hypothetical protein